MYDFSFQYEITLEFFSLCFVTFAQIYCKSEQIYSKRGR